MPDIHDGIVQALKQTKKGKARREDDIIIEMLQQKG